MTLIQSRKQAHSGVVLPQQRSTVRATASIAIDADTRTLLTLDAIAVGGEAVEVYATVQLQATADVEAILKLFRDGSEIDVTDRYQQHMTTANQPHTVGLHWVDLAPGNNPVYSLRAEADVAGRLTATVRRATART